MPNINFPSNPTASQTYTFNGATWTFNGVAWSTSQPGFGPQGPTGPGTGGSSLSIPLNQIVFGTGSGVTSSSSFTFDISRRNLISSTGSSIGSITCENIILGGSKHSVLQNVCNSSIIGGVCNNMCISSKQSSIFGGCCNTLGCNLQNSSIIGGFGSTISYTNNSAIIAGVYNQIISSVGYSQGDSQTLLGGFKNKILTLYVPRNNSSIIGGACNSLCENGNSIILGGGLNCLSSTFFGGYFFNSSIVSGCNNKVYGNNSSILSGSCNLINYGLNSNIIGGVGNTICTRPGGPYISGYRTDRSVIIGGCCNVISGSCEVSIIAGERNTLIASNDAAIISGRGLSFSSVCQRVIVPTLILASASIARPHINFIAGASPSVPINGDMWYDGTNFWIRSGSQSSTLPGSTASTNNAASNLFLFYNY